MLITLRDQWVKNAQGTNRLVLIYFIEDLNIVKRKFHFSVLKINVSRETVCKERHFTACHSCLL